MHGVNRLKSGAPRKMHLTFVKGLPLLLSVPAALRLPGSPRLGLVSVRDAEEGFVDATNLEAGETCVRAIKAFDTIACLVTQVVYASNAAHLYHA